MAGIIVEKGPGLETDYMGEPLAVGTKVALPPLMPCGQCHYCRHYPEHANKCLNPTYYGRYLPFDKPPHLWGGWAEMVYVDYDSISRAARPVPDDVRSLIGHFEDTGEILPLEGFPSAKTT